MQERLVDTRPGEGDPAPTPIHFVTFHADTRRSDAIVKAHPNTNLEHLAYMEMIDILLRSARLFHPGAHCTLLSSPGTDLSAIGAAFRRIDSDIDPSRIMLERTRSQMGFVEAYDFEAPVVLTDSDIIVNGPLNDLFAHDFDIGVTWRDDPEMPLNGGVIFLHNRRPDAVRSFFRRFYQIYLERHSQHDRWYGDQLALRDCLGVPVASVSAPRVVEDQGRRILVAPCDIYNYSPPNRAKVIARRIADRPILHFKGARKRLMRPYWEAHLRPMTERSAQSRRRAMRARLGVYRLVAAEAWAKAVRKLERRAD